MPTSTKSLPEIIQLQISSGKFWIESWAYSPTEVHPVSTVHSKDGRVVHCDEIEGSLQGF